MTEARTGGWRAAMFEGAPRFVGAYPEAMGGLGGVFVAFDRARYERVAIMSVRRSADTGMIVHELEVLRGISHPNVLRAYDLFGSSSKGGLRDFSELRCLELRGAAS
jgi:hypothetical protein